MGSPPPPPPARPVPPAIRWGLGDAVTAYFLSGILGPIVAAVAIGVSGGEVPKAGHITLAAIVGLAIGLDGSYVGWLAYASRSKGRGTLRADFGVKWPRSVEWWALPMGYAAAVVIGLALVPIAQLVDQSQAAVDDLNNARGATLVAFVVFTVILAPIVEELVFRGLLLRSLLRRTSVPAAVAISAIVFAGADVVSPLGFDLSAGPFVPGLFALGVLSGILAVRSGNLARSMLLHAGFNLLAVSGALASILRPH